MSQQLVSHEEEPNRPTRRRPRGTLVATGSSTKYPFDRLVAAVLASRADLPRPIVVQHAAAAGVPPPGVTVLPSLPHAAFLKRLAQAELVISHAGVGTILEALQAGVPTIVMPRDPSLGEVADGHQLELARELSALGLVQVVNDANALRRAVTTRTSIRRPDSAPMNRAALAACVHAGIRRAVNCGARAKIALVATSGGHMAELRQLESAYAELPHFFVESKPSVAATLALPHYIYPSADHDWRAALHAPSMLRMLLRERPGIVLSTGSSSVIPVLMLAKLGGIATIYVESLTRVRSPSFTGRCVYPLSDLFIVRWPDVARRFARATLVPVDGALQPTGFGHPAPVGSGLLTRSQRT